MGKLASRVLTSAFAGLVAVATITMSAWAQTDGGYRSKASGNWKSASSS
jgi:hypothetical protein